MRGRFQGGMCLNRCEDRTMMGKLARGLVLPLPFDVLVLFFCHPVHVSYAVNHLPTATWQAMGLVCIYIVHTWCTHILGT